MPQVKFLFNLYYFVGVKLQKLIAEFKLSPSCQNQHIHNKNTEDMTSESLMVGDHPYVLLYLPGLWSL